MEAKRSRVSIRIALLIAAVLNIVSADFTSECPSVCRCKWLKGSKGADCTGEGLKDVPNGLHNDVQILDLSNNPLYEITQRAFENVGLNNLKKLTLRDCKLEEIHRDGFSGLSIIIEVDLSKNNIKALHADTFKETEKVRWIFLNNNLLEKLEDGLFRNLPFLQKVELSNNRLLRLGVKTFINVPGLKILRLDGNKLTHMKVETLSSLALSSLDLNNNPWRCDCNLQAFRNWAINKNLYTPPTSCAEPPNVFEKLWSDLDASDFACKPSIIYPTPGTVLKPYVKPTDNNVTLSCRVSGNPIPDVKWVLNSQVIDSALQNHGETRYYISEASTDLTKWFNLTIMGVANNDNGDYMCVAKNSGGIEERGIKLNAISGPGIIGTDGIDSNVLPVLIGLSVGAAILLILVVILCYCFCQRREAKKLKMADHHTSNGEALIEGSVIPEMEKSLITAVNPVTKPPRRYDVPSVTSGATDMSELNKTLLDNDSVFAPNEDESRSLDFDHPPKRSHETLSMDYLRQDGRAYPPDLLSFPPRAAQISPAASNASTVPDTSRLPQINPVSPVHTPIYGTNPNLFRTLPYSRSQSPFTSPVCPSVVTPRQGYVTIPRRPRVPSWSSTTSTMTTHILPTAEAQEPLYDNLGLRTTADGSSVLSLNKAGLEPVLSPMRGRPLPATPTTYQNPHQVLYAPIEEHEPAPSPVPSPYTPNPRSSISSHHQLNQFSTPGPQEPVNPRMSWTAKNTSTPQPEPRKKLFQPEKGSLKRNEQTSETNRKPKVAETGSLRRHPGKEDSGSPKGTPSNETQGNESNVSLNQSGTLGRSGKIPPRPPPKPKKKPNSDSNEPLFEDEGEDGTEV